MQETVNLGNQFTGLESDLLLRNSEDQEVVNSKELTCWLDFSRDQLGKAAAAVIMKNKRGRVIRVGTRTLNYISDVLQGEFEALFLAMKMVQNFSENQSCLFLTDNQEVANVLESDVQANRIQLSSWMAKQRAQDCILFKRRLKDPTFKYTSRNLNLEADSLANLARVFQIDFEDLEFSPLVRSF